MSETAQQAFNKAENALRGGKYAEALHGYMSAVLAVPNFWRGRFRIGDALLSSKATRLALDVYRDCAWHAMKSGHPLDALVAVKMAALIDKGFSDGIDILAELYSKDSQRVSEHAEVKPVRMDAVSAFVDTISGDALLQRAQQVACDFSGDPVGDGQVPPIPLFSFLDEQSFGVVLQSLQLRRFIKGQVIVQEGKPGDSFFMITTGAVSVSRTIDGRAVQLARLHQGAVFGEMALISRAPRTATVTAEEDCDLLELKRGALEEHAHKLASVTKALHDFTHDRFLSNLTATSPIFKPFARSIRTEIIRKFKDFPVNVGDELIVEGEQGQGLYLVMKGEIEVSKHDNDGHMVRLATLKEGDVFGEIALIQDTPTTATCKAMTDGTLLFLPKEDFKATMRRHPEMKDELSKITAERIAKTHSMLNADDIMLVEDDDLVML